MPPTGAMQAFGSGARLVSLLMPDYFLVAGGFVSAKSIEAELMQ